jgi:hypothetical protein
VSTVFGMDADTISAVGGGLSGIGTAAAVFVSWMVYRGQRLLSQRQLLIPLWDYMSSLNEVNAQQPITPDVLKVVNTLELVALSCEGGMVDPAVIRRTFRNIFMKLYEQVDRCGELPGLGKTGRDLLKENPAAMTFYQQLLDEHLKRDRLKP